MFSYVISVVLFIPILLLVSFPLTLILAIFFGPPFVPTPSKRVKEMIALTHITKENTIIDLGSGNGRLLIAAAKKGAYAIGWEINGYLVIWTKIWALLSGVGKQVEIHWGNYHSANLRQADIIFIYSSPSEMAWLEKKAKQELKLGSKVISYTFFFPDTKPALQTKSKIYIYTIKH